MRTVAIMGAGAIGLAILAGCDPGARPARMSECRAAALTWQPGGWVSPMTGEHAEFFGLVNRGRVACFVRGYPAAVLYDGAGRALPFRYGDGGGPYLTRKKPRPVPLKPGARAYVVIAKYRCDLGDLSSAKSIRLRLRLAGGTVVSRRLGVLGESYCVGGRHDPGQLVTISPLEPSLRATVPGSGG
jgi:Domain of unknown function (DUF4232)